MLEAWGANIRRFRQHFTPSGDLRRDPNLPCMTQKDLAEAMDPPVSQSTVARWEDGVMEPRRHFKIQLARQFCTDVAVLFPIVETAA